MLPTETWDKGFLSSQIEYPIGANSAQVVSVTQWRSLGYCVSSPVHHKTRKAMQVSIGWGCHVTPPVKPHQTPNCVIFPLPYETQEPLILLKMQERFASCFFTGL